MTQDPKSWAVHLSENGYMFKRHGDGAVVFYPPLKSAGITDQEVTNQPKFLYTVTDETMAGIIAGLDEAPVVTIGKGQFIAGEQGHVNQDAGLSLVTKDARGNKCIIAAIADGVSTANPFAERGSRLACLAAIALLKQRMQDSNFVSALARAATDHSAAQAFKKWLWTAVGGAAVEAIQKDVDMIAGMPNLAAPSYSADWFSRNKGRFSQSHATTLAFTIASEYGTFVFNIGDGAITSVANPQNPSVEIEKGFAPNSAPLTQHISVQHGKALHSGDVTECNLLIVPQDQCAVITTDGPGETLSNGIKLIGKAVSDIINNPTSLIDICKRGQAKRDDHTLCVIRGTRWLAAKRPAFNSAAILSKLGLRAPVF